MIFLLISFLIVFFLQTIQGAAAAGETGGGHWRRPWLPSPWSQDIRARPPPWSVHQDPGPGQDQPQRHQDTAEGGRHLLHGQGEPPEAGGGGGAP